MSALPSKSWLSGVFCLLVGVFLVAGQVSAAGLFCRSDPVVILSNGIVMDFGANISTLPWNVEEVHYELHIPVGVTAIVSIHTPTWIGTVESFTIYADQPPDQYIVTGVVSTRGNNVGVSLDATLVSLAMPKLHLGTYSSAGLSEQLLTLLLNL